MTDKRDSSVLVTLDGCHHTPAFPRSHAPGKGEEVWCLRCREYRPVVNVLGMYQARCENCRYSRWFGAALLTAQTKADEHVRKSAGHRVDVLLAGKRVSVHGMHAAQLTLDDAMDIPPF